ncbi:transcriptional regulator with XRE-family HTH domain [Streptomyces sp. LBL]|uniref:helix-turn-helix domain-containing protein n=1 Tax=Streptomyces sp. LBL TaxID=2940562 RepID=UPI00247624F7|nr:helix-turn-helix transcriptional regulator [Streptomyces sp. LBL]MDH6629985.1 transcriptional regulator with XRE-family HTH domain [Streptomyces sp. LBL]
MGLRTTISERQRRLGFELKQLREQAGLTTSEAAERIGMTRGQLGHIEAGRTSVLTERLLDLCRTYGCSEEPYIEALVAMSESTGRGWWRAYRKHMGPDPLNLAELESEAVAIRTHEPVFIPGLFQTEDYTRSIFTSPDLGFTNIEEGLRFRMERQHILTRDDPPSVDAIIHESALHMRFGSTKVVREQLLRLIELARLPNVTIRIYPFTAQAHAALTGNFAHVVSANPRLGTVVVEQLLGSHYLVQQSQLEEYSALFNRIAENALPPIDVSLAPETHSVKDSLALVQHVLYAL